MKFLKNIAPIIALCAINAIHAKGLTKKEATTTPSPIINQPQLQPRPTIITNRPVTQPQPERQQQAPQKGYEQILTMLQDMQPTTDDFLTLVDIQTEVNKQIVKAKFPTIKSSQMRTYAQQLVNKYKIPLKRTQAQLDYAAANDTDLFSEEEMKKQTGAINQIVENFIHNYPNAKRNETRLAIHLAITEDYKEFQELEKQITTEKYEEITKFITDAINKAWVRVIAAKHDI